MYAFFKNLDRRWIFLAMLLAVALPILFALRFPEIPSPMVRGVFDAVGSMTASNGRPLDLLFGVRYVALKATVDVAPLPRATARESWLDPVVGLRYTHAFNERWDVRVRGDIGGFSISSRSSELATNVSAIFGWHIRDKLTLRGGYRMLQMDFDGDSLVLDATLQGYVVGASWAF